MDIYIVKLNRKQHFFATSVTKDRTIVRDYNEGAFSTLEKAIAYINESVDVLKEAFNAKVEESHKGTKFCKTTIKYSEPEVEEMEDTYTIQVLQMDNGICSL